MKEKYIKEHAMSIKKFLKIYMGINDSKILDSRISHKDLKYLNPNLKRLPYNYAFSDMKSILSGNIIIVIDDYGNYIPYEAPQPEYNVELTEEYKITTETTKSNKIEKLMKEELEKLSTHQLSEICNEYKKNNRSKDYNVAYRILREKKQKEHKSIKYMKGKGKI